MSILTPKTKAAARQRRHHRLRQRIRGTAARPRLAVYRSLRHLSAQLIDDALGRTLLAADDRQLAAKAGERPVQRAERVGQLLAERAQAAGISQAVFDRGGFRFHGQIRALADGARASGLRF